MNELLTDFSVTQFQQHLLAWYNYSSRSLPWRDSGSPYQIWLSEVMLQQTQVIKVVDYYNRFIDTFPTIFDFAAADLQLVLKLWEGLGYYARARNFHRAARLVVEQFNGELPTDYDTFRSLPGVGGYIAAAVQSIAFGKDYAVVDGNVKRVLARLLLMDIPVNDAKGNCVFQQAADQLLEHNNPGDYNQSLMELGALICRPRQPLCVDCPVRQLCRARQENLVVDFPKRKPSKKVPIHQLMMALIFQENRVLIVKRPEDGMLGALWEFPNAKVTAAGTGMAPCEEMVQQMLKIDVTVREKMGEFRHAYSHFKINVDVFACDFEAGLIKLDGLVDFTWVTMAELSAYPLHQANHKIMEQVKKVMNETVSGKKS